MQGITWSRRAIGWIMSFGGASALGMVTVAAVSGLVGDGPKGPEVDGAPLGNDGPVEVVGNPPALPVFNPWLNDLGQFWVPAWDDRRLPEGVEREPDPRWPAFVACLEARGQVDVRGPDGTFVQSDMDRLVHELNVANPDGVANKQRAIEDFTGQAAQFLACANEELTKPVAR